MAKHSPIVEIRCTRPDMQQLMRSEVDQIADWQKYKMSKKPLYRHKQNWYLDVIHENGIVDAYTIMKGVCSDKGSVPKIVPDLLVDNTGWLGQTVIYYKHDADCYLQWGRKRNQDLEMFQGMLVTGVSKREARASFLGVRIGGWVGYKKPEWVINAAKENISRKIIDKPRLRLSNPEVVCWKL